MTRPVGSDQRSPSPHATSDTSSTASNSTSLVRSLSQERTTSRQTSRSKVKRPGSSRAHSAACLDDHAVYHNSEDSESRDEEEDDTSLDATKIETVEEVRDGILNERDVDIERGQAPVEDLEKSRTLRSTKSRHGGKLVSSLANISILRGLGLSFPFFSFPSLLSSFLGGASWLVLKFCH